MFKGICALMFGFIRWDICTSFAEEGGGGGDPPPPAWHESQDWGSGDEAYTPSDRVKEFGGVRDLASGYDNAMSKIQSKGILIPGENATEDETSAFKADMRDRLGLAVPESSDKYSWAAPEGMEDQFSKDGIADQLKAYHDAGFSDEQASAALNNQVEAFNTIKEAMKDSQVEVAKATEIALKEKFGDDYGDRMAAVNKLKDKFPGVVEKAKAAGLGNDQEFIEMFDEVARSVSEGKPLGSSSKEGAATELAEITKMPLASAERTASPYYNKKHPEHKATMARVMELQRNIHNKG